MSSPRVLRLRRPPVVSLQEGVFVPAASRAVLDEVEERWRVLRENKRGLFDGRVCHVLGVHRNGHGGAVIHAMDCAYRFHAVQDERFDVGMRGLGVKGIVMRNGAALLGKRTVDAATYPGMWEFVPGGVVEPGAEPEAVIERELAEETGLRLTASPTATAIMYDPVARVWEIVYTLAVLAGEVSAHPGEHDGLEWTPMRSLIGVDLSPIARQIAESLTPE